jgi:hypothetical protein
LGKIRRGRPLGILKFLTLPTEESHHWQPFSEHREGEWGIFKELRKTRGDVICIHATTLSCLPRLLSTQPCKLLLVSLKIVKAKMPACQ